LRIPGASRAESRFERLIGAQRHALGISAERVVVALAAATRFLGVVLVGVLGTLSGGAVAVVWACALAGLVSVAVSVRWQWRHAGAPSRVPVFAALVVEMVLLGGAAAASGGTDSLVLYIVLVVIIGGALLLRPAEIVVMGAGAVVGIALLGARGTDLATWAVLAGWATAVGASFSTQRGALLARVRRLDRQREGMAASVPDAPRVERVRVGVALRQTVLDPVAHVAERIGTASGAALGEYARELAGAASAMRTVVSALHSPSGAPAGLDYALRRLGARHAPRARIEVALESIPPKAVHERLVSVARDLLDLVVDQDAREVRLRVHGAGAVLLDVAADPAPALSAAGRAAVRDRLGLMGAQLLEAPPGALRASVGVAEGPLAVDPRFPGRDEPMAVRALSVARVGTGLVVVAGGALVGGTQPGFWPVAAAMVLAAPIVVFILETRRFGLYRYGLLIVADQVLYLAAFALAGDAATAALPLLVAVPLCYALLLGPVPVVLGSGVFAAGLAVVSDLPPAVWLAYAWSAAVAVLMAWGTAQASRLLGLLAEQRRVLQGHLLAEEEAARRRLAGELHDDALQLLLATRQDLAEAAEGDAGARERAGVTLALARETLLRTLGELEEREGQPAATEGLRRALERAVDGTTGRDGPQVVLEVDEEASGLHDGLVVRLVRELVLNARKHAEASAVHVEVHRIGSGLLIDVADDGVGWKQRGIEAALMEGHIGLASATERVLLAGGRLELGDAQDGGARVLTVLPPAGGEHRPTPPS